MELALWHGFTWVLALSLLTLAIAAVLYRGRGAVRAQNQVRDPSALSGCTQGACGYSMRSAHGLFRPLQGASLRSYVRALMVTAGTLVTVVLVSSGLPGWP